MFPADQPAPVPCHWIWTLMSSYCLYSLRWPVWAWPCAGRSIQGRRKDMEACLLLACEHRLSLRYAPDPGHSSLGTAWSPAPDPCCFFCSIVGHCLALCRASLGSYWTSSRRCWTWWSPPTSCCCSCAFARPFQFVFGLVRSPSWTIFCSFWTRPESCLFQDCCCWIGQSGPMTWGSACQRDSWTSASSMTSE